MKFHLLADQEALQDTLLKTAARACPPERRREIMEAGTDHHSGVWKALMDAGLGGLLIPEHYGGTGLGLEAAALAFEMLGQAATPGAFMGHVLAGWALAQCDNEALKDRWLAKLAVGDAIATVAMDIGMVDECAIEVRDGRLDAEIALVGGADQAQLFVVGVRGGLAVVEAGPGVCMAAISGSDLTRRLWSLTITGAAASLIPSEVIARRLADAALILLAADALGGAQQCLSMSVAYAKTREQFGVAIGQFQAVKHQLANMALEVEPARALVWYAAYAWDLELPDSSHLAAHAKAHLADRFVSVARAAVQVHGGLGYTWDYDLQIWFRRSLFDHAFMGGPSFHRRRAASLAGW